MEIGYHSELNIFHEHLADEPDVINNAVSKMDANGNILWKDKRLTLGRSELLTTDEHEQVNSNPLLNQAVNYPVIYESAL